MYTHAHHKRHCLQRYANTHTYVYSYVCIPTHIYNGMHKHTRTPVCTYVHTHRDLCVYMYTHTSIRVACVRALEATRSPMSRQNTYIRIPTPIYTHTHTHRHTHICIYIHTHLYIHIYTHTYLCMLCVCARTIGNTVSDVPPKHGRSRENEKLDQ